MKTNDEIESILAHLIEKLNRVEADVAHRKITVSIDPATEAVTAAITMLDNTIRQFEASRETYKALMKLAGDGK